MEHPLSDTSSLQDFSDSIFQTNVDSAYIAGASVIVFQNGEKLLDQSYGYGSLELSAPIPDDASFEIGSVTKQFTAVAILQLEREGKLNLDDDFTKYIDFDTKGRTVTINHLLNHTSGIPSYTALTEFWDLSIEKHPRDSLVRLVEQKEFLFEPGEALIYNNSGYFLLGLIIEKVSGQSYEEYLRQKIFEPLGMNHTTYCSTSDVVKGKVYGYNYTPNGLKQKPYLDHTWPFAAGSLCSTSDDLLIWMQALHGKEIVDKKMYHSITTPGTLNDGTPIRYAKGLVNYTNFGHEMIGHGGGIHGFLSETRYFPEEDLYIICLINTTGPRGAGYFADAITWKMLEKVHTQSEDIDLDLESLVGEYQGQARGRMLTADIGVSGQALTLTVDGQAQSDTLNTYLGKGSWLNGNDIFTFRHNTLNVDNVSGHYILKRKE